MEWRELFKPMKAAAIPRGYRARSPFVWKSLGEITLLGQVHYRRHGKGACTSIGFMPTVLIVKPIPPHLGCWGAMFPSTVVQEPYRGIFHKLEYENNYIIDHDTATEACDSLLGWQEDLWPNDDAVRDSILGDHPLVGPRLKIWARDWASGNLKNPVHYFYDAPYYTK